MYYPEIFSQPQTEAAARELICNPEQELSPDQRWEVETAWLLEHIRLLPGLTIDYGCGIGRLTKHLPGPVVGVDISASMLAMAQTYVDRRDCVFAHPEWMSPSHLRACNILAVWVLQHIPAVEQAVTFLRECLIPSGLFWVVDHGKRHIPVKQNGEFGWAVDRLNTIDVMYRHFQLVDMEDMPAHLCNKGATLSCWRKL